MDFLPSFLGAEHISLETPFNLNFSSKSSDEAEDDFNKPNNADSYTFISSILGPNPMPSFNEIFPFNSNDSENKDESFSSSSSSLFTNLNKNSILVKEDEKDENMLKRKRFKERRPRKENQDNIRKKIKRGFFNGALLMKLNEKLQSLGSKNCFKKFSKNFVGDVSRKRNNEIFKLTLREIFENKELYSNDDKHGSYYFQNLKIVQCEEIKENKEFKKILNKTIAELYEEYINSNEFNIEVNRLKEKKMQDDYINRYINLARHLILFFTQ